MTKSSVTEWQTESPFQNFPTQHETIKVWQFQRRCQVYKQKKLKKVLKPLNLFYAVPVKFLNFK